MFQPLPRMGGSVPLSNQSKLRSQLPPICGVRSSSNPLTDPTASRNGHEQASIENHVFPFSEVYQTFSARQSPLSGEGNHTLEVREREDQLSTGIFVVDIRLCGRLPIIGSSDILDYRTIGIGNLPHFFLDDTGEATDKTVNVHFQTLFLIP